MLRLSLMVLLGLLLGVAPPAEHGMALSSPLADPCPEPNDGAGSACVLPQPDALGTTIRGDFTSPSDVDVYRFEVPPPGALAHVTLADLWADGRLRLFDLGRAAFSTEPDRQGPAQGQFLPPRVLVRWLEPGSYAVYVGASPDGWESAPSHSYTLRVALGPAPVPTAPGPFSSAAAGYQLTLAIEPTEPTVFSLMTFTATLDPPFTDLFDFSWSIDGQPLDQQSNAIQLARPAPGSHNVLVIARGARLYPDPHSIELPPTLSASATFDVR
jgi:hypothetical protein